MSTEESTRGGGSRELCGLGEVRESELGITSGSVGSGITSVDDAGVVGFDVDEDALEGNAVGDGAVIQVDHLDESGGCSGGSGDDSGDAGWARHDESFDRVHRDLGTELTAIWPDTEWVVLGRCIRSGRDGGVSLRCGRTDVAVFSWVLVDLDHGGLDLAVSREKLEIFDADGYADVRGAVGAQPGKCGLDLRTANTKVLVGVVCC